MNVQLKRLEPSDPSLPSLVLQITQLVDTYMLWIGIADGDIGVDDAEKAVLRGNLSNDWACAMPPRVPGTPPASTSLFRSSSSDIALSMAQRLARRFQKQIFLSVDIPSGFLSLQQEGEKGIVESLKELEANLK
ncbi:hypothetical protein BYT27DRAFT_7220169 [Phlegmacium glaucopus]|nr:hypothetical protein BYT27DRAFT_7220169 [Phlegmacium glaucopus]